MKGYDKELVNKTSKMTIIFDIILVTAVLIALFTFIAITNEGVKRINSRFDTTLE